MNGAPLLQLISLALLWLQLLLQGQLQPLVALALPGLLALRLRRSTLQRPLLLALTLGSLVLWALGASLGDRTALLQSACNLLWLLCGLKLLEARSHNEQRRCSLLLLLSVGLAGVAGQQLAASLLQGLCALLALASLLALEGGPRPLGQVLRRSGVLVAVALPVLLAAFVLLPRLEPLWSLQLGNSGRSGLSDRLAPGELASLVSDNSLAARISFAADQPPPAAERYWRVLVHQRFDGNSWSAARTEPPRLQLPGPPPSAPVQQRWMVEPSGLRQRPWGGSGMPMTPSLQPSVLGTISGAAPLQERSLYTLQRDPMAEVWRRLPPDAADLQLPPAANPRLLRLGQQWQQQGASAEAKVLLARQWFLQQGFRYTLEPGSLGPIDPLDRFLFETRAGFCEHFAASFSALMRAAGVPARVVVGYQGGAWQQPAGGSPYLELRNSDAHAWSEVYLAGRGWVRVDPTAWVVPERIRRSLADSLSEADRQRLSPEPPSWVRAAVNQWQGLDYRWQLWVMGFDRQRQRELLGESRWQGLIAISVMAAALALGLLPLLRQQEPGDPMRRRLNRLLRRLEARGYPLQSGETLTSYCERVGRCQSELAGPLQTLALHYTTWRFAPAGQERDQQRALSSSLKVLLGLTSRVRGRKPTA